MPLTQVQRKAGGSGANVTTLATVYTSAPTQNNLLLCRVNSDATVTMTSTGWTLATSQINNTGLYLWYKVAGASESSTVTVAPTSSASIETVIEEWSGNVTASPLDKTASTTGASTGTTAATTQADEQAIAQVGISGFGGAVSATWTNTFTAETSSTGAGTTATGIHPSKKALSATGTQTTTATLVGGGVASGGLIATFKASAGGGSTTFTQLAALGVG